MKSPLETQINRAFQNSSSAGSNEGSSKGSSKDVSDLPVSGVISSPKGWRRDPINGESDIMPEPISPRRRAPRSGL